MQVKPKTPIRRSKPSPQLVVALEQQAQRRTKTIREQAQAIHARVEYLRAATYLLLLRQRIH